MTELQNIYGGYIYPYAIGILLMSISQLIGMWQLYKKAGYAGWECIIPIYNMIVLTKIAWGKWTPMLLLLVPIANIVFIIMLYFKLAKAFNKSTDFGFGLLFLNPIFTIILGCDDSEYVGV